tara:strand:+ start:369 stop:1328 length:960 start_codon:yes stop_codon:yes gene_type:complete
MAEDKSKMVDLDTSGDEVEIVLDEQESKNEKETKDHGEVKEQINVEEVKEDVSRETSSEEQKTEDSLDDYSDSVQKRIARLTKKYREAERQREEALKYAEGLKKQYDESQSKYSQLDKGYLSEFESRVTTQTEVVKDNLKRAIQARDADAIVKAQEQLSQLTLDNERLKATKKLEEEKTSQAEATSQAQQIQQPRPQQPTQPDPKAEKWARDNSWFGQDEAMTYAAFGIHKKLIEEEGFDAQSDEYYNAINSRMRKEFPHKFSGEANVGKQSKPVQTVASAKRVNKDGRRSVRLTPSQVAIAKRLGVPLEEYARYVKEA